MSRWATMLYGMVLGCGNAGASETGTESVASDGGSSPSTSDAGSPLPLLQRSIQPAGFSLSLQETAPADNALTEERAQLGKRLFFDPILSRDRTVSCSTCHRPEFGFAEPFGVSTGIGGRIGVRNAPHLANLAWVRTGLFWDGRVTTLEEQATKPIEDPLEMDLRVGRAVDRLLAEPSYVTEFQAAYDATPTVELLAQALASFVRTLVSAESPYDRYLAGDENALSNAARRGLAVFLSDDSGCFHCHSETTLTNDGFFNNGTFGEGGDVGRQAVTGRTGDLGKFRVPSLRNVAVTAPYMHDGSLATLEDVVDHYARGGNGHPSTDVQIGALDLSERERADLVAFLSALTDEAFLGAPELRP